MKSKYKLIIFDLDGTAADTDEQIFQTLTYLYDKYRNGVRTPREKTIYFSGPPMKVTLANEFPGQDIDMLDKEYRKKASELCPTTVKEFPECTMSMNLLKEAGYKIAVVTSKSKTSTKAVFDALKWNDMFSIVVDRDDVTKIKPDPEGMNLVMQKAGASKEETIYIGDNVGDYLSAKNAGIDFMLANWGPRDFRDKVEATYVVNSLKEMRDIFL